MATLTSRKNRASIVHQARDKELEVETGSNLLWLLPLISLYTPFFPFGGEAHLPPLKGDNHKVSSTDCVQLDTPDLWRSTLLSITYEHGSGNPATRKLNDKLLVSRIPNIQWWEDQDDGNKTPTQRKGKMGNYCGYQPLEMIKSC